MGIDPEWNEKARLFPQEKSGTKLLCAWVGGICDGEKYFLDRLEIKMLGATPDRPQTMLIDADDTLWENNIYFERAIASFISWLDHGHYTPEQIREKLYEVEREHTVKHGYGVACFSRSLATCFEHLSPGHAAEEAHARIAEFAQAILDQEIELLPGVAATLPLLASRHRLILMTKGNEAEQAGKLARSGLRKYFTAVEIPREKNPEAYVEVCGRHSLMPAETWMIGNSPRSDINPALACGLNAIYIQHPSTWALEHERIDSAREGRRLIEVESFAKLAEIF
jgi:putative hydrolase of the HAD superfamily